MICERFCILGGMKPIPIVNKFGKNAMFASGMPKSIKLFPPIKKKISVTKKMHLPNDNSCVVLEHKVASSVIKQLNIEFKHLYGPLQTSRTDSYDSKRINESSQIVQHETQIPIRDPSKEADLAKQTVIKSPQNPPVSLNKDFKGDLNVVLNFPLMNKRVSNRSKLQVEISELNSLRKYLVQGAHNAVLIMKEAHFSCLYQNQECVITVHFENGFILQDGRHHGILWQYSFEKLRMSADDGMRLVWLDFGGEDGEKELDLLHSPKPFIFTLHTFLSAKVIRLGLIA